MTKFKQDDNVARTLNNHRRPDRSTTCLIEDEYPVQLRADRSGGLPKKRPPGPMAMKAASWSFWYSNIDVRDDRIAFFATHLDKGTPRRRIQPARPDARHQRARCPPRRRRCTRPAIRAESERCAGGGSAVRAESFLSPPAPLPASLGERGVRQVRIFLWRHQHSIFRLPSPPAKRGEGPGEREISVSRTTLVIAPRRQRSPPSPSSSAQLPC